MNQWIRQSDDGAVAGKLVLPQADGVTTVVDAATVGLVSSNGEMVTIRTDADGGFRFEDITPGVYTLISRGTNDVCSVIALHIVAATDQRAVELPQAVEIAAGQVEFAAVKGAMLRYLPPTKSASSAALDANVNAIKYHVLGHNAHRILQSDGGLVGQVYGAGASGNSLTPSSETNVFVYHGGEEVARVLSDAAGAFQVESLAPGVYTALVVGASGMGVVGFELVSDLAPQLAAGQNSLVNAQQPDVSAQLVMQVAPGDAAASGLQDLGAAPGTVVADVVVDETIIGEEVVGTGFTAPMGGGGFAGGPGATGGGGGGLGGGRAGGLLAIGGLAAGIVALATDDDSTPPIATPAGL